MKLLHGSARPLGVGFILSGRGDAYRAQWESTDFYAALERYRPVQFIPHAEAVFLAASVEDVGLCGGSEEFYLLVVTRGRVSRHDMNWSTEISCLISDGKSLEDAEVARAAHAYWHGETHRREPVWEYLCREAEVIACFDGELVEKGEIDPDTHVVLTTRPAGPADELSL